MFNQETINVMRNKISQGHVFSYDCTGKQILSLLFLYKGLFFALPNCISMSEINYHGCFKSLSIKVVVTQQ